MEPEVLVIGGGVTGCGVAWDLALRGLTVTLVERGDIGGGTSGRYHGLLHSGARYAVSDPVTAGECFRENALLKRLAPQTIDDTGGLFVLLPTGPESFVEEWLAACTRAEITVGELSVGEAFKREPGLARAVRRAFEVPDAVCHSLRLCGLLRKNAESLGARFLTFHRLDSLSSAEDGVAEARLSDVRSGKIRRLSCRLVVNAAGPWSGEVAAMAGASLRLDLARGAMVAFEGRLVGSVLNTLQPPDDGDVILPRGRHSIAGTTTVATSNPDDRRVGEWELDLMRKRIGALLPGLEEARVVHSWSAVRPLYDPKGRANLGADPDPRRLSRDFTVIDHAESDGVEGMVTIVGGKLTTFRLMAEKTGDAVCRKLGMDRRSATAATALRF
jgi:glycerol-3-phosphate dehydrogenase